VLVITAATAAGDVRGLDECLAEVPLGDAWSRSNVACVGGKRQRQLVHHWTVGNHDRANIPAVELNVDVTYVP
jgi:hypothetical protein